MVPVARLFGARERLGASVALALPAALTPPRHMPGALALGSVAVLALLCTALSMLAMFYLIRPAGAARTAIVTYINPVIATALGVLVLDERLGWSGPLGPAIILVSVRLATAVSDEASLALQSG